METVILGNKYKIVDTLFQNELQRIYVAEDIDPGIADQFLINEVADSSIIDRIKNTFHEDGKSLFENFLHSFNENTKFYIVSSISSNATLDNYLSTNSLRLSDKMLLTENLLIQLSKLENANNMIKYHLLNTECVSVAPNRAMGFNLDIKFDSEGLFVTDRDIIDKLGDLICCIFANTSQASLEKDKDSLPPAILSLIKKCKDGTYGSFAMVYKDFKASLLYATFVDNSSVDKQIMKNIQKAKRKRSGKPVRRIAALLLIAALLTGGYYGLSTLAKHLPVWNRDKNISRQENQIPIASFTMSKSKVYAGDRIDFVSQSTDPDIDDKISSYEWSVSRNNDMYVLFSRDANPSYVFEREGDYVVSLIVKDSTGISSNACTVSFKVYPKEEIPDTPGTGAANDPVRK